MRLAFTACFLMAALSVTAQGNSNFLKAAEDFYSKGDYYSAAKYYEKYLTAKPDKSASGFNPYVVQTRNMAATTTKPMGKNQVTYKIAECYRLLNNPVKAEPYYKESAQQPEAFPLAQYYYAKSLKANSKFEEAEAEFNAFIASSADEAMKADAQKELQNLSFIKEQLKKRDLKYYTINKLGANINPHGANYAPVLQGSTLIFTSTRADSMAKDPHLNRLYWTSVDDNASAPEKINIYQESNMHQGVSALTPDGNTMFLTKWLNNDAKKLARIYVSRKEGDKWSDPVAVAGDINAEGYSSQQPSVSPDGKYLYYSSNKPGTTGGFDIWMASLDGSNVGASSNAGSTINTKDDEQAPYFWGKGSSLIFSSNGRVGMGGFDFFQSNWSNGAWQQPVNLGYPMNSVKDDLYLVSTGTREITDNVYLSSDRASECCLELFALNKIRPKRTILGAIVDCDDNTPLADVTVAFIDANGNTVSTKRTDANGKYDLILDDYQPLRAVATKEGYHSKELSFNAPADEFDESMTNPDLCLNKIVIPPQVDKPIVLENVYYDFDKATLKPESFPSLDSLVALLNFYPKMVIEIGAHTDSKGSDEYNMDLSTRRAKSVVDYLISKGIDASRLQSKGYGETMPVAPNTLDNGKDNPEGRAKNRRTEFKVISNE